MPPRLSRQDFQRWAEAQPARYERVGGEAIAMAPERIAHVRLKTRIWAALDRAIRAAELDCEALGDGVTIEVDADTDYQPDAVVNRGPRLPPKATAATTPVVVVEVLSPPAESVDSGEKLADYFRVPSIQHYLIVRSRRREIIHHRRSGPDILARVVREGTLLLEPPGIRIDLAEVHGPAP